jgi:hypothetical protein
MRKARKDIRMTRWQGLAALAIAALLAMSPASARSREPLPPTPGTPVASVMAFAGGWQTVMSRTAHYTLVLQITNTNPLATTLFTDLYVTGQMFNTDGATELNGTLQGIIPKGTRTLQFSLAQPGANRGGSGQLILSLDGNSISGSGKAGDAYFTWRGTRAK